MEMDMERDVDMHGVEIVAIWILWDGGGFLFVCCVTLIPGIRSLSSFRLLDGGRVFVNY